MAYYQKMLCYVPLQLAFSTPPKSPPLLRIIHFSALNIQYSIKTALLIHQLQHWLSLAIKYDHFETFKHGVPRVQDNICTYPSPTSPPVGRGPRSCMVCQEKFQVAMSPLQHPANICVVGSFPKTHLFLVHRK